MSGKSCFLCKSNEDNELLYGKFYTKWKMSVHYYCLLLSSNLVQNGVNDEEGIFGFLAPDIRRENERTKKCRCYICKKMHANVFCCAKKCLRTFHTVCGIKNRCLSHYTDTFQSWCESHVPLKTERNPHDVDELCSICYEDMGKYDKINSIRAPCCKNGWFHRECVARFAQTAGYFFKCPLCNNVDTFLQEIPLRGVFVPERDAAWELEPNAFQEQLERPSACDAQVCKCPQGRETDNRHWDLQMCGSCGSTCRHRQCMAQATKARSYVCEFCKPIVGENVPSPVAAEATDEDERSSVCSTSSDEAVDNDDDDDDDDDKSSTPGSGESGVHCSSSDEAITNVRRKARTYHIQSDSSDSEQSDTSSIVIRRFLRRNTGKRVRRVISEDSSEESRCSENENQSLCAKEANKLENFACQSQSQEQIVLPMDENSNTSGTSSISVESANARRKSIVSACKRRIDSTDDSDNGPTKTELKVRLGIAGNSNASNDCSDSSDDDVPLIKRRRVATKECSGARWHSTEAKLNTSNEENICPIAPREQPTTPPSQTAKVRAPDGESNSKNQNRLQQSMLKFVTRSPPGGSNDAKSPAAASDNALTKPESSSSNKSKGSGAKVTTTKNQGTKKPKNNGSVSTVASSSSKGRLSQSPSGSSLTCHNANRQVHQTPHKAGLSLNKKQGQLNLLNYFTRC